MIALLIVVMCLSLLWKLFNPSAGKRTGHRFKIGRHRRKNREKDEEDDD
jgi:hypothetical protein